MFLGQIIITLDHAGGVSQCLKEGKENNDQGNSREEG